MKKVLLKVQGHNELQENVLLYGILSPLSTLYKLCTLSNKILFLVAQSYKSVYYISDVFVIQ